VSATEIARRILEVMENFEGIPVASQAVEAAEPKALPAAPAPPERFSCTCYLCKAAFISTERERVCRSCGARAVVVLAIKGKRTEAPCNATCWNARGHLCECSCAGLNHGKTWITGFSQATA
jgi:hypothetical protein